MLVLYFADFGSICKCISCFAAPQSSYIQVSMSNKLTVDGGFCSSNHNEHVSFDVQININLDGCQWCLLSWYANLLVCF
jgi:hypothetical protein